ncbi:hypothetical protein BAL199_10952 [alpha proteobacterium BAL199]|jgi:hypothetical protein|nr:hypothetical protein BAL199_10952 [alpha proteobacterium BAL199]
MTRNGFYIPHRYAASVAPPDGYPELDALFVEALPRFRDVLDAIDRYGEIVDRFNDAEPPSPRWQQDWFPGLDGAAAYALVRETRPNRIVEVGSGHSTRFLARAVLDAALTTEIVCIDPAPRADISGLAEIMPLRLTRRTLQDTGIDNLPALNPGDILFIDSSHLALPGTDVDLLFGRVLPRLPAGVLVHVHDVFLPDRYPESWEWRGYAEQMVVAAWLAGGGLRLRFASRWARTRMADELAAGSAGRIPLANGAYESSIWAVTTGPVTTG